MSTGHVLLGLLARADRHGYDLKHEHDARFPNSRPLAFGQVYAALERLDTKGFVQSSEVENADGPNRNVYQLTSQGRDELNSWLSTTEVPSPFVANPLAVKTTMALLAADRVTAIDFMDRQRAAHLSRMRELTKQKLDPASTLSDVLAADFALAHLDADVRWLETALERIVHLEQEVHA